MINWTRINPEEFEKFCAELLELNGFENLQWYGKGGADKSRDIVATKTESPISGVRRTRKWVVQCKRYVRAKIGKHDINEFLIAAREHDPDAVLLIVTTTLTAGVRDWIEAVRKDYKFEVFTWEERDIEREFRRHGNKLSVKPSIIPQKEQPILFYEVDLLGRVYMCNEIDEVGFYLMNPMGLQYDIEQIRKFIDFLRHNEIVFHDSEVDDDSE